MLNEMYSKLDLNNKRNELNNLLVKIDALINECTDNKTIDFPKVKNYDINKDNNLNEEEMLSFIYEDLWNIKNKILYILMKNGDEENKYDTN